MSFLKQSLDNIKVWINEKIEAGLMDEVVEHVEEVYDEQPMYDKSFIEAMYQQELAKSSTETSYHETTKGSWMIYE